MFRLNLDGNAVNFNQETKSNSLIWGAEFIWKDKTNKKHSFNLHKLQIIHKLEMGGKEYKKLKKQLKKDKHADLEEPIEQEEKKQVE